MEERIIKWLDITEMKILKQIIIVSDRQNGEAELGIILYTRTLTENYNLIKQQEEDNATENPWSKFLQEYPKQNNFPVDRIDEIILQSVRKVYPKTVLRNDTIFFNVDLEKIKVLKNRIAIKSIMLFSPEFSQVMNYQDYIGREFKAPQININIYSYYRPEFLDGLFFYANYNVEEEKVLRKLNTVSFQ